MNEHRDANFPERSAIAATDERKLMSNSLTVDVENLTLRTTLKMQLVFFFVRNER